MSACIIPIPAEVELSDAGVNYTPFVKSATPPPPGEGVALPAEVSLTLEDGNTLDTLFVRAFRDYQGTPYLDRLTVTNDPETGGLERTVTLPTNTWCNGATAEVHEFQIMVADREFSERPTDQPPYQSVTQSGKFSSTFWSFRCGGL